MDIINVSSIPAQNINGRLLRWIVGGGALHSGLCSSCIVELPPGESAKPPHSHLECEESIFILSGRGEMRLEGGAALPVSVGDYLLMRVNEIHMLMNSGDTALTAICFYSAPTSPEKYEYHPMESVSKTGSNL